MLSFTFGIFNEISSPIVSKTMPRFQATIFVGIALLVSNGITLMVADKMPRRSMLILSSLGISLSLIGMGVQVSSMAIHCGHIPGSKNTLLGQIRYTLLSL
jgi:hypothetical protein